LSFRRSQSSAFPTPSFRDGLQHDIGLVIAKSVQGVLAASAPTGDILRQIALFGAQSRDGWGVGLTILTALGNLLPACAVKGGAFQWVQVPPG
jgi:hypothetical protein